jgi:hypothetical protein
MAAGMLQQTFDSLCGGQVCRDSAHALEQKFIEVHSSNACEADLLRTFLTIYLGRRFPSRKIAPT